MKFLRFDAQRAKSRKKFEVTVQCLAKRTALRDRFQILNLYYFLKV